MIEQKELETTLRQLGDSMQALGSVKGQVLRRIDKGPLRRPRKGTRTRSLFAVASLLCVLGAVSWLMLESPKESPSVSPREKISVELQRRIVMTLPPTPLDDEVRPRQVRNWAHDTFLAMPTPFAVDGKRPFVPAPLDTKAPKPPLTEAELLTAYRIEPTVESVTSYFRDLRPNPDWEKLSSKLIAQLGDEEFTVRESAAKRLLGLSKVPIEALQKATRSSDPEIVARARRLLDSPQATAQSQIEQHRPRLNVAVCRLICEHRLRGVASLVLANLSSVEELHVREAMIEAVVASASPKDRSTFRKLAKTKNAHVQVACVRGLGRIDTVSDQELRAFVLKTNPEVALATFQALAERGDVSVLPELVRFASHTRPSIRAKSVQILRSWSKQNFALNPFEPPESQRAHIAKWQNWVRQHGETLRTKLPLRLDALPEDLEHGLLVYYSFEDDPPTKIRDRSGNEFHALLYHASKYLPGVHGKSLWVTGTGQMGDRGGHALLPFIDLSKTPNFSISMWVYERGMSSMYGEAYLVIGTDRAVGIEDSLGISHFNQELMFRVGDGLVRIPFDPNDRNRWVHYAMTFSDSHLRAYKHGRLIGETKAKVHIVGKAAALGRHWWHHGTATSSRFMGGFDEVRIYERALTPEAIQSLSKHPKD